MAPGHVHDARRDPDKILLHQAHLPEVIAAVGVEAGADEDHLRRMRLKPVERQAGDEPKQTIAEADSKVDAVDGIQMRLFDGARGSGGEVPNEPDSPIDPR